MVQKDQTSNQKCKKLWNKFDNLKLAKMTRTPFSKAIVSSVVQTHKLIAWDKYNKNRINID